MSAEGERPRTRVGCLPFDVVSLDAERNFALVEHELREACHVGVRLVVLPELWPTSFHGPDDDVAQLQADNAACVARITELARELDIVVAGTALARDEGRTKNRFHLIDRGVVAASHDKLHLFRPTAEGATFGAGFAPGRAVDTSAGRIGGIVCYDLRFPEVARVLYRDHAEIIVVCAQWGAERAAHWRALCIGRAVESQAFVVACNGSGSARIGRAERVNAYPGNALIVDPDGRVLAEGDGSGALIAAEVDLQAARRARRHVPVERDERRDLYARW